MLVTKATAAIQPGADDSDSENGSFDIILSAQTRDRDGDVFKSSEWKQPLPEWIPIDVDHAMSVEKTVGSGAPFINDNGDLQVRGSYASTPLAQQTRTLVAEGHVRYVSVAVMTDKSLKDGTPNRELLNGAFVNTPSNREAVILASKSLSAGQELEISADGKSWSVTSHHPTTMNVDVSAESARILGAIVPKAGARNSAPDSKMIQAIHDASSLLGADCATEAAPDAGSGADEGANKGVRQSMIVGKALTGSIEDLRDRLSDALQDVAGDGCWIWVRATFLDAGASSGTVVYDLGEETYSRTFSDEDGLISLGSSLECVTFVTSVAPAAAQVDDDPVNAVEGSADAHDGDPETRSAGTVVMTVVPKLDSDAFKAQLDAVLQSSGIASPESSKPADPPAAPSGPAAGEAAEEVEEAQRVRIRDLRLQMLADDAKRASVS